MSSPVRILTVANHLGARGGLERTQLTNCGALAARGHRVDVLYVSAGDFADDWRAFAGSMVPMAGSLPRRQRPLRSAAGVVAALAAGARLRPDVLYVYRYWDLPLAVAIGTLVGAPVVFHLCLPPPTAVPVWLRAALGRVAWTLSVSRDTAERWAGTGLHPDRLSVALTGIDLHRYRPADAPARTATRRRLGVPADAFVVLYAGRIGREKGVHVLVRAVPAMAAAVPELHVVVAGSPSLGADPEDSARYEAELHAAGAGQPVSWTPAQRDVVPLLQAADVAVAPSLWPEPLSRSVMEPLACGVPVVATRVGGNPEILTGELSSYLVEPDDAPALARRVVALRGWRRAQPGLEGALRHHAEDHLSLEDETAQVEDALRAACDRRRARRRRSASAADAGSCG